MYLCEGCEENGDSRNKIEHPESCKGKKVIKVCVKSGKGMHVPKD